MGEDRLRRRAREDERAGFSLAARAHIFSERARAVVDDKLTFGAMLMRAGEIGEAARVIDEVERDVHAEQEVLLGVVRGPAGQAEAK